MSLLVVGDVHGCADELDELLQRAGPQRVLLVGDLFTKGPDPVGVWRLIGQHSIQAVLGNHDDHLLKLCDGGRTGNTGAHRALHRLDALAPGWETWLRERPLFAEPDGWVVVHAGLHPSGSLEQTTRSMALTMRRWPTEAETSPRWWEVYQGGRPVVFGHDARQGLVRIERDGLPWLIGLDTGCVYGGQLTGWWPTRGELVQVQARSQYKRFE